MNADLTPTATSRSARTVTRIAVLATAFLAGIGFGRNHNASTDSAATRDAPEIGEVAFDSPTEDLPDHAEPAAFSRPAEPRAIAERARAMRRDAAAIIDECQRAAGGDWERWQQQTVPYQAALQARIDALQTIPQQNAPNPECTCEALAGDEDFPLFEVGARQNINYLYNAHSLDAFRRQRPIVAVRRWLRRFGIDLIFVPVPKMTEIYSDRMLDPCPRDGIIAPHIRRALLELLQDDVEVIDGFRIFRAARDTDAEYLYNASDPHWAPRAMRIMAKEIADRVERYSFGGKARFAIPIVRTSQKRYVFQDIFGGTNGYGRAILSPQQAIRASAVQTIRETDVHLPDGRPIPEDRTSPVMLVSHSYGWHFREQLIKELNLLVDTRIHDGGTTEFLVDFLREPALLDHCRVIVWLTTEQHLTQLKPLPPAIRKILATGVD